MPTNGLGSTTKAMPLRRRRIKGEKIRQFIVDSVESHPLDVGALAAAEFKITRQAAHKHLSRLVDDGLLVASLGRKRSYKLKPLIEFRRAYPIVPGIAEHDVWDADISSVFRDLPKNVLNIWQFCFTEMFNNAVDHSGGAQIYIEVVKTTTTTRMLLNDDGVGIFKKIQTALGLADERHAIFELSKGKLTTDPQNHTGQGIFFTSRLLDSFDILAGGVFFTHKFDNEDDWLLERPAYGKGTTIFLELRNDSPRIDEKVFKEFSSASGYAFAKTVVPVKLAQYGQEKLVSRSQAKQLLARVDRFENVILDFSGVDAIGQAFTDEIFRVFARSHPQIKIVPINTNLQITEIIAAAVSDWLAPSQR